MKPGDLFLVIDMQKVYLPGAPWGCPKMEAAQANILRVLNSPAPPNTIFTVFQADPHAPGAWQEYNRENRAINQSRELNQLTDPLAPWASRWPVYEKATYSSLSIPQLRAAAQQAGRVVVAGVVAECCVLSTVLALIDLGCPLVYLTDAAAGISPQTEQAVVTVLEGLAPLHLTITTTQEYLDE